MELTIKQIDEFSGKTQAVMIHRDSTIPWNISVFEKTSFSTEFGVFDQINAFWKQLPLAAQDKIFATYERIRETFDTVWDTNALTRALYKLVAELYTHQDLTAVHHWVSFHSTLIMPDSLRETFTESHETPATRERTYLKEDYRWLVAFSVSMRAMVPVWGEFISRTKDETGTTFKEYYAFKLLAHSSIMHSPTMQRLQNYVTLSLPGDKSKSAAILGWLSSEDFPVWITAMVVVRRLSVADVRGLPSSPTLARLIYNYITFKAKGHDNSFIGAVKEKIMEGSSQEGENNLSVLESYKIKQEIAEGDIAQTEFYMLNVEGVALKVMPDLPLALLKQAQASVRSMQNEQILVPSIVLMQWVLRAAIPPRSVIRLSKLRLLDAMAVTVACLWHREHYELAALVSAVAQTNQDELQLGGVDSRARIPKEMVDELSRLHPYQRRPSGKQKTTKPPNPAVIAIDALSKLLSEHDWKLTIPLPWVVKVTGNKNNRRYSAPHDIKVKLAALAIAVAGRTL